jgi:hypothetical protein
LPVTKTDGRTISSRPSIVVAELVTQALLIEYSSPTPSAVGHRLGLASSLVAEHRVGALLLKHSRALGISPELEEDLRNQVLAHSMAGLRLIRSTEIVHALFEKHSFNHLFFKGVSLSVLTGREPAERGAGDVDVLIGKDEVPRAHRMLVENGFVPKIALEPREGPLWSFLAFRERELSYRKDDIYIDLHWRVAKDPHFLPSTEAQLNRAAQIPCGKSMIPTLSPADALAAAAQHIYLDYCQNLRLIVDLVYLSWQPNIALPPDTPPAGRALASDMLEFARVLLARDLVPGVAGATQARKSGVAYLLGMWVNNSSRTLLEAGPKSRAGEGLGRLWHWLRYSRRLSTGLRFIAWAFFAFPDYRPEKPSTTLGESLMLRMRQVLGGRLPYLEARRARVAAGD